MSKELARKLIQRIANDSIRLAIVRNCLEWDKDDLDMTEDEIVEDAISVVNGDDIGCAEESELTPENSTHLFVQQELDVLLDALESTTRIVHEYLSHAYDVEQNGIRCKNCSAISGFNTDRQSCRLFHQEGCPTLAAIRVEQSAETAISAAKGK